MVIEQLLNLFKMRIFPIINNTTINKMKIPDQFYYNVWIVISTGIPEARLPLKILGVNPSGLTAHLRFRLPSVFSSSLTVKGLTWVSHSGCLEAEGKWRPVEMSPKVFCPSVQSPGMVVNSGPVVFRDSFSSSRIFNTRFFDKSEKLSTVKYRFCFCHLCRSRHPPLLKIIT